MTPTFPSRPIVSIACALMTANCAASRPASAVAPPRLTLPETAIRACDLYRIPDEAAIADLEIGYMTRGSQIAACDAARRLAVETLMAERLAQDAARPR